MILQFAGIAAFVVLTVCVGLFGYVAGRLVSIWIYQKQINQVIKTAAEEIVKIHNTYTQFVNAYDSKPTKKKNPNLSIVRKDNPPE